MADIQRAGVAASLVCRLGWLEGRTPRSRKSFAFSGSRWPFPRKLMTARTTNSLIEVLEIDDAIFDRRLWRVVRILQAGLPVFNLAERGFVYGSIPTFSARRTQHTIHWCRDSGVDLT
jgi:hypothetical protein